MKMKRICACLLCLLMLLGAVACGNDTQKDTQTTTSGQSSDTTTGETTTTEAKETLDIPDTNYNTTFNILMTGNWKYNDFEAENIYGEPINDARYQVNSMLKDLYGITVAVKNDTGVYATGAETALPQCRSRLPAAPRTTTLSASAVTTLPRWHTAATSMI